MLAQRRRESGEGGTAEELAQLIRDSRPCTVLTGAGVSTESGIPDFRSPAGIWRRYDPLQYATIEAFRRDPARVWDFYGRRLKVLAEAEPNAGHRALARLEHEGLVEAVVTQNVDGLHRAAGSREVIEVHGSLESAVCLRCGTRVEREELARLLEQGPPPCPRCGAIVKPGVVMFGELLPEKAIERATELARRARLMLVVGSSLEVWPVAGLPQETLATGGRLAIVNREPTPYDARSSLVVHASAGEVLARAAAALCGVG